MFREMRRNKQLLSMEDTISVMGRCTNGVLACLGDDDYPYEFLLVMSIIMRKFISIQQRQDIK